ncbi:hypothetical protein ACSVHC_08880 [Arthrobacter sp. KNU-44]|uniref:hypothetical protein n=1 Tax=Arthrobacter sp. KNU-44 TaxID=3450744 RepID=UPI003F443E18
MKSKSYYALPIAEERLRPLAEDMSLSSGSSYDFALESLRQLANDNTMALPRYMTTITGSHVRLWGKNIVHNGGKP